MCSLHVCLSTDEFLLCICCCIVGCVCVCVRARARVSGLCFLPCWFPSIVFHFFYFLLSGVPFVSFFSAAVSLFFPTGFPFASLSPASLSLMRACTVSLSHPPPSPPPPPPRYLRTVSVTSDFSRESARHPYLPPNTVLPHSPPLSRGVCVHGTRTLVSRGVCVHGTRTLVSIPLPHRRLARRRPTTHTHSLSLSIYLSSPPSPPSLLRTTPPISIIASVTK